MNLILGVVLAIVFYIVSLVKKDHEGWSLFLWVLGLTSIMGGFESYFGFSKEWQSALLSIGSLTISQVIYLVVKYLHNKFFRREK